MRSVALFLGLLAVLAGCAGGAPAAEPEDEFDDVELEADDKTGVIRGVVVDDAFVPVASATIVLDLGGEAQETTSDEQGRFGYSKVPPGTYFLTASADLHTEVQFSASVEAGVDTPDVVNVQLTRIYSGDPFVDPIKQTGFFQCSQANMPPYWYSSSSCHDTYWVDLSDYGVELDQERDFHADIGDGWQTMVFEMDWQPSAQGTSDRMGIVVSTYKPEREGSHWFENHASSSPMRFQLDVGEPGQNVGSAEPAMIPEEGIEQMSYFMSVRPPADATCVVWCFPPGLALDQDFTSYLHVFYYLPAPEGWSILAGDAAPY